MAYVIAGILQVVPGLVLDAMSPSHSPVGTACHYTIGQYCDSFIVFPIASVVAFGATLGIRESFPARSSDARTNKTT